MKTKWLAVIGLLAVWGTSGDAHAQYAYYQPWAAPVVAAPMYYAPPTYYAAPVYYAAPTYYAAPVVAAPYYATPVVSAPVYASPVAALPSSVPCAPPCRCR